MPEAIGKLPPIFRQVLELRLQANRSYGEISDFLGIPSRTVGTRILRARRQLRAILEEQIAEAAAGGRPSKREEEHERPETPAIVAHAPLDADADIGSVRHRARTRRTAEQHADV